MICRGDEQTSVRPSIELNEDDIHDPFQFSDVSIVITPFGNGVKFVEKEDAGSAFCIVENGLDIAPGGSEVARNY